MRNSVQHGLGMPTDAWEETVAASLLSRALFAHVSVNKCVLTFLKHPAFGSSLVDKEGCVLHPREFDVL